MSRNKAIRRRWFLCPPSADVDSYVVVSDEGPDDSWRSINLKIADCNRHVNIGFSMRSGDIAASRAKFAKLKAAIDLIEERLNIPTTQADE